MRPTISPDNSHGKAGFQEYGMKGIVMSDCSNACNEILNRAPTQTQNFGKSEVLSYGRLMRAIDVLSPRRGVRVRSASQFRKEIEFQMIMAIYQSRQDQKSFQIENRIFYSGNRRERNYSVMYP